MSLFIKQKQTHRQRKRTMVTKGESTRGGIYQGLGTNRYKFIHKADKQQRPTVQHRELFSISCNSL